ncbi:HPX6 [Trypoxylus dichotomus]
MIKTERTALIAEDTKPKYVFQGSIAQRRKRQLRQFQICLSTIICLAVIVILVTTVISLRPKQSNSTNPNNYSQLVIPSNNLLVLPGILQCNTSRKKYYNDTLFNEAIKSVGEDLEALWKLEKVMPKLDVDTPSFRHQIVTATTNKSNDLAILGLLEEMATKKYYETIFGNNTKNILTCTNTSINGDGLCSQFTNISCVKYMKFRTYDGTCNNLKEPFKYGVGHRPFRRILPPDYADVGISEPRLSIDGNELPSARTISNVIHRPYFKDDPNFTVMLAVWGQFLDHDITSTAATRNKDGSMISCCDNSILKHPECFQVKISNEDPYYNHKNITCMNFIRSAPAPNCCLGPREQMNQVSAYIDGSVVYGSNLNLAKQLRTLKGGLLKMFRTSDHRELLPISNDSNDGCNREEQMRIGRYCFISGDARANENLHLTSMHLIWARQHNKLAKKLGEINKHWDDERIYQEARKILAGQMQHITYNEFLKILIGERFMKKFDLVPKKNGYYHDYDPNLDATIANSFATSTFRFAHSLIPSLVRFIAKDVNSTEYLKLHEILFDPFLLYQNGELDKILTGAIGTEIQANDAFFTPELKQHLFEKIDGSQNGSSGSSNVCGLDLVSLNIQRGRDHGLPGYVKWRTLCKLSKPKNFDDLSHDIDPDILNYISSVYRYVEDIDLYTGSLSEKLIGSSLLGPTLHCLIIDQFIRLKRADRYWYENPGIFTANQLREIRKSTLASVLCENSDNVTQIQSLVMERRTHKNDDVPCSRLQKMNLAAWSEKRFPHVSVGNQGMVIGYRSGTYGTARNG